MLSMTLQQADAKSMVVGWRPVQLPAMKTGNGAVVVAVGGTVVVGLTVVVDSCVVEEVVVETARVFDVKLSVVVGPGNLWDDAGIGDRPLGKRGCSW